MQIVYAGIVLALSLLVSYAFFWSASEILERCFLWWRSMSRFRKNAIGVMVSIIFTAIVMTFLGL